MTLMGRNSDPWAQNSHERCFAIFHPQPENREIHPISILSLLRG